MESKRTGKPSKHVTDARAAAQRAKLDAQAEERCTTAEQETTQPKKPETKKDQRQLLATRRANTTIERAVEDYLSDHEGGNDSKKTLEWHHTALGLLQKFLLSERDITLVGEIDAPDINAWFVYMRKTPEDMERPEANVPFKLTPVPLVLSSNGSYAAKP